MVKRDHNEFEEAVERGIEKAQKIGHVGYEIAKMYGVVRQVREKCKNTDCTDDTYFMGEVDYDDVMALAYKEIMETVKEESDHFKGKLFTLAETTGLPRDQLRAFIGLAKTFVKEMRQDIANEVYELFADTLVGSEADNGLIVKNLDDIDYDSEKK